LTTREDHFYGVEAADGLVGADMLLDEASVTELQIL
jgi:UDP-N-acetylglucosamine 1-carboxyvinyltransferase